VLLHNCIGCFCLQLLVHYPDDWCKILQAMMLLVSW